MTTVYIGTYTEVLGHVPFGKGRGIEGLVFDSTNGSLTALHTLEVFPFSFIYNS